MKKVSCLYLVLVLIGSIPIKAQVLFDHPLSPRIANYRIQVHLDPKEKVLYGQQRLIWRNPGRRPTAELRFHLYMNAFRNEKSTFFKNGRFRHRRFSHYDRDKLGGIDIAQIILNERYDITDSLQFIQPDDGNRHDSTVVRLPLPFPISAGDSAYVDIRFQTRLPKIIARTGYVNDFFALAQWFPKIGVFTPEGWNCHQFHPTTEFFADFGVYQVEFTLPREYTVGASGILLEEKMTDSTKTLIFRAEDVHDFALTAWPDFRGSVREIEGVTVTLLYAPEHEAQVERYFTIITQAMAFFNKWLMPYPYPNLTIVDPPLYAYRAAGMEYPCLIMAGSIWGVPQSIRLFPEEVTVHEYAHQYFYGILASNEFEDPWLDEGFTSFATHKFLSQLEDDKEPVSSFLNLQIKNFDFHREGYRKDADRNTVVKPGWEFKSREYAAYAYDKPMLILQTLENFLGEPLFHEILKTYLERWEFRHPTTRDFIDVVNEKAPQNMDWFFQQALFETHTLDYELEEIAVRELPDTNKSNGEEARSIFESRVKVKKNGTFYLPVEIEIVFSNGDTLWERWEGKEPYRIYTYVNENKVVSAHIDPRNKIWLDLNWTNNSLTTQENRPTFWRYWVKFLQFYQMALAGMNLF
ncbi:MAG: M1 family metallopeptidase [Calditrichia bacterium]